MTKSEFDTLFGDRYNGVLASLDGGEAIKERLRRTSGGSNSIPRDALFAEALMLSFELSAKLLHSVLTEVLEFGD